MIDFPLASLSGPELAMAYRALAKLIPSPPRSMSGLVYEARSFVADAWELSSGVSIRGYEDSKSKGPELRDELVELIGAALEIELDTSPDVAELDAARSLFEKFQNHWNANRPGYRNWQGQGPREARHRMLVEVVRGSDVI